MQLQPARFLQRWPLILVIFVCGAVLLSTSCAATAVQIIPTARPSDTPTFTPSPTATADADATTTPTNTRPATTATGGPSPTPLFGPTSTAVAQVATSTRPAAPGTARIEFFTADVLAASPGSNITLFWSTRGVNGATIYRVDREGIRSQLWNVPPDGSLPVSIGRSERVEANFVLSIGEGTQQVEETLTLPLSCPDAWFFTPPPDTCPESPPQETRLVEQQFERGRMLYVEATNRVYALFNDGLEPAWVLFENRFDPAVHPEVDEGFVPPPPFVQPARQIGFVWRGNDLVRNRLGLGTALEVAYEGFVQSARLPDASETVYASSADETVVQLVPGGEAWQIITQP